MRRGSDRMMEWTTMGLGGLRHGSRLSGCEWRKIELKHDRTHMTYRDIHYHILQSDLYAFAC